MLNNRLCLSETANAMLIKALREGVLMDSLEQATAFMNTIIDNLYNSSTLFNRGRSSSVRTKPNARVDFLKSALQRYLSFEFARDVDIDQVFSPFSYSSYSVEYSDTVDFVFKSHNTYEAVKYRFEYPSTDEDIRSEYLQLALMYVGLKSKYPCIRTSIYYLLNKNDSITRPVKVFNKTVQSNIISPVLNDIAARNILLQFHNASASIHGQRLVAGII